MGGVEVLVEAALHTLDAAHLHTRVASCVADMVGDARLLSLADAVQNTSLLALSAGGSSDNGTVAADSTNAAVRLRPGTAALVFNAAVHRVTLPHRCPSNPLLATTAETAAAWVLRVDPRADVVLEAAYAGAAATTTTTTAAPAPPAVQHCDGVGFMSAGAVGVLIAVLAVCFCCVLAAGMYCASRERSLAARRTAQDGKAGRDADNGGEEGEDEEEEEEVHGGVRRRGGGGGGGRRGQVGEYSGATRRGSRSHTLSDAPPPQLRQQRAAAAAAAAAAEAPQRAACLQPGQPKAFAPVAPPPMRDSYAYERHARGGATPFSAGGDAPPPSWTPRRDGDGGGVVGRYAHVSSPLTRNPVDAAFAQRPVRGAPRHPSADAADAPVPADEQP